MSRTTAFGIPVPSDDAAWLVVTLAGFTALLGFVSGRFFGFLGLEYALAVPAGILFGPWAAVGVAFGGVLQVLPSGAVGPGTLVEAVADAILVLVGGAFWGDRAVPVVDPDASLLDAGTYVVAALVACACGVAWLVSAAPLLVGESFVAAMPVQFTSRALPLLTLGPLVLLVGGALRRHGSLPTADWPTMALRNRLGIVLVASLWLGGGFLLGLVHQDVTSIPKARAQLVGYLPGPAASLALLVVEGWYRQTQAAVALVATAVVGFLARRG